MQAVFFNQDSIPTKDVLSIPTRTNRKEGFRDVIGQKASIIFCYWFSITSSAGFVEWSQMLSWSISWDEITQANCGQRDKTVVHWVQITPLVFEACKNSRRNQKQGNQYGQKYLGEKIVCVKYSSCYCKHNLLIQASMQMYKRGHGLHITACWNSN